MKLIALFFFLFSFSFAGYLETCYRIYILLVPVAESCVKYRNSKNELTIDSWVRTIVIGKLIKKVRNWGKAQLIDMKPVYFELYQREGSFERDHYYHFRDNGVEYSIIKFKGDEEREEITQGFFPSSVFLYDPISASVLIYLTTPNSKEEYLQVFYDEKLQNVRFKTLREENIEIDGKKYRTWKVVIVPEIYTKGSLKPTGRWYIWIDKSTFVPVRLELKFNIGSARVYLKYLRGDPNVLRTLKKKYMEPGSL